MIELRYLTESGVRKLQYRVQRFHDQPPFSSGFNGWGPWIDVPEFQESNQSHNGER